VARNRNTCKYSMNTYIMVDVKSLDLKPLKHNGFYMYHYFNNKSIQFALAVYEYWQTVIFLYIKTRLDFTVQAVFTLRWKIFFLTLC